MNQVMNRISWAMTAGKGSSRRKETKQERKNYDKSQLWKNLTLKRLSKKMKGAAFCNGCRDWYEIKDKVCLYCKQQEEEK